MFVFWIFVGAMALHAAIHVLGFAKAFEFAELPALKAMPTPTLGLLWLAAALLTLAALAALLLWPRWWWLLGALALVASQSAIMSAWEDAKWGSLLNAVLLIGVVYGFLTQGPTSLRAGYERDAGELQARLSSEPRTSAPAVISERDLAPLPAPVQRYLRATGALGQPHIHSYQLRFRGRIRSGPDHPWMSFRADQQSSVAPVTRLFFLTATMKHLPVQVFHRFIEPSATMRVKVAGLVTVADASGPVMNRSETVTVLNDLCILAPWALVSPSLKWQPLDDGSARVCFTAGTETVCATLYFDDAGLLANFVSDDRSRSSPDGRTFTRLRFSTPVGKYRQYGPVRLASWGEARYHAPAPEGEFAYGEFELLSVSYKGR